MILEQDVTVAKPSDEQGRRERSLPAARHEVEDGTEIGLVEIDAGIGTAASIRRPAAGTTA